MDHRAAVWRTGAEDGVDAKGGGAVVEDEATARRTREGRGRGRLDESGLNLEWNGVWG